MIMHFACFAILDGLDDVYGVTWFAAVLGAYAERLLWLSCGDKRMLRHCHSGMEGVLESVHDITYVILWSTILIEWLMSLVVKVNVCLVSCPQVRVEPPNKQVLIQLELGGKVLNFGKSFPKLVDIAVGATIEFLYGQGV